MTIFRSLFSFSRSEVLKAFSSTRIIKSIPGFKLLQSTSLTDVNHGKLLIITPRSAGKAHMRNKLRRQIKAIYYQEKLYAKRVVSILILYHQASHYSFDEIRSFLVHHLL